MSVSEPIRINEEKRSIVVTAIELLKARQMDTCTDTQPAPEDTIKRLKEILADLDKEQAALQQRLR